MRTTDECNTSNGVFIQTVNIELYSVVDRMFLLFSVSFPAYCYHTLRKEVMQLVQSLLASTLRPPERKRLCRERFNAPLCARRARAREDSEDDTHVNRLTREA